MRPRKRHNQNLPPNLYSSKKGSRHYFRYRNPVTGKEHGLGTDKQKAITAALSLNNQLLTIPSADDLIQEVLGGTAVSEVTLAYYTMIESTAKDNTLRTLRSMIKKINASMGERNIKNVTTEHCAELIDEYFDQGKERTAQALRSTMRDIFNYGIAKGKIERNPVTVTRSVRAKVKRDRLTLDTYRVIYEKAETLDPWVANSMLLAMITGQRLSDIQNMQFRDVSDGWLHVVQKKTGSRVRLSLDLRLDVLGPSLRDVVARCRDRALSPYLIHHTKKRAYSKPGEPVHENTISKGFRRARELTDLTWNGSPATFNELRSLSGRLHRDEGRDPQALLGHKDSATTAIYLDGRNIEWISVA